MARPYGSLRSIIVLSFARVHELNSSYYWCTETCVRETSAAHKRVVRSKLTLCRRRPARHAIRVLGRRRLSVQICSQTVCRPSRCQLILHTSDGERSATDRSLESVT